MKKNDKKLVDKMGSLEIKNVISEIEFASLHCNSKIIGVTGSNGKTTTTTVSYTHLTLPTNREV